MASAVSASASASVAPLLHMHQQQQQQEQQRHGHGAHDAYTNWHDAVGAAKTTTAAEATDHAALLHPHSSHAQQHHSAHPHEHPVQAHQHHQHQRGYLPPWDDTQTRGYAPVPQQQQQQQQQAEQSQQSRYSVSSSSVRHHDGAGAPAAAASSTVSASTAQPALSAAPFHSYPHIHFRLPANWIETAAANGLFDSGAHVRAEQAQTQAQENQSSSPPATAHADVNSKGSRDPPSSPNYAHVPAPSMSSAPFQSLLATTTTASGSGSAPRASASASASSCIGPPPIPAVPAVLPPTVGASPLGHYRLSFRAMHHTDIGAVAALHDALFPVKYDQRFYYDLLRPERITLLAFLEFEPIPQQQHQQSASSAGTAVVDALPTSFLSPLLVGVGTGRCRSQSGTCRRDVLSGYVTTLGVDYRFRRLGLGKFLLQQLIRLIREHDNRCESIHLHVKEGNGAALLLYRSCGFRLWQRKFDHYHIEGRDYNALEMRLTLNNKRSIYDEIGQEARGWCSVM